MEHENGTSENFQIAEQNKDCLPSNEKRPSSFPAHRHDK